MDQLSTKTVELNQAREEAASAGGRLNKVQESVNQERIEASERTGWFAGATISLSFTLIGYLLSKDVLIEILKSDSYLLGLLLVAWICLGVSILGSLLTRLLNANYLNYNEWGNWISKKLIELKSEFGYIDAGGFFSNVPDTATYRQEQQEIHTNHEEWAGKTKKIADRYLSVLNICTASVYVGSVLGIALLIIFLIRITILLVLRP